MGVAVARSLDSIGIENVGLKWPNDIIVGERKIGGVLLDIKGESTGPLNIVIGIGINYELPKHPPLNIDQPVTDICSTTGERFSRNMISAILLSNIFEILYDLELGKNLNLINEWRKYDCYLGRKAALILPNQKIIGVLKGVDDQGSLLMLVDGELSSYRSGEVSLRMQ
jgi:BirA family biotin operon repressor/biotin-[acetyl-CoA-carboxylase] ligase